MDSNQNANENSRDSVEGGSLVARGGTAEVFAWESGVDGHGRHVLKLFHEWVPRERVEREFEVSRALRSAGLPVAQAHELVEKGNRTGIVFERIEGISMLAMVERAPWRLFHAARLLAELHAQVHRSKAPAGLPRQREQIEAWLAAANDFSADERIAAEMSLAALPDGETLCHGDFHPANILFSKSGPVIIDWIGATRGYAYADVARTSVLFESAELPKDTKRLVRLLFRFARRALHRTYLGRYLQVCGGTSAEIEQWRPAQRAAASAWRCGKMHW